MFAERLKLARKGAGLSLRNLAEDMGRIVSAQAIGRYERGEMLPSSPVLIGLSKALNVSPGYLLSPSAVRACGVEFRKTAKTRASEHARVEAAVLSHLDRYLQIEELLGLASHEWGQPKNAPYPIRSMEDAENAAHLLRKDWNLGGDPIPNITELLEEHGIKVLNMDFSVSVDGLTCKAARPDHEDVPVIAISAAKSVERQRFTLAHELGHLLVRICDKNLDEERVCHRFASALLMPRDDLLFEIGKHRHRLGYAEIIQVKQIYGVSAAALMVRLKDLGIISQASMATVFRGMGRKWRSQEPAPIIRSEQPLRFQRLVFRALAEDIISLPKASELLGWSTDRIIRQMHGPGD